MIEQFAGGDATAEYLKAHAKSLSVFPPYNDNWENLERLHVGTIVPGQPESQPPSPDQIKIRQYIFSRDRKTPPIIFAPLIRKAPRRDDADIRLARSR